MTKTMTKQLNKIIAETLNDALSLITIRRSKEGRYSKISVLLPYGEGTFEGAVLCSQSSLGDTITIVMNNNSDLDHKSVRMLLQEIHTKRPVTIEGRMRAEVTFEMDLWTC